MLAPDFSKKYYYTLGKWGVGRGRYRILLEDSQTNMNPLRPNQKKNINYCNCDVIF